MGQSIGPDAGLPSPGTRHRIVQAASPGARTEPVDPPGPGGYLANTHVSSDSRPEVAGNIAAEPERPGITPPPAPHTAAQTDEHSD